MLKKRIIPKLQMGIKASFRGAKPILVVTKQFGEQQPIGDPLSQAKIFEAQLADELVLVDLVRTNESWKLLLDTVESMADALATPLSVGGGLHSYRQVQELLDKGADKVIINSAAYENPNIISLVANNYGAQCLIASIDVRQDLPGNWSMWSDSGEVQTERGIYEWCNELEKRGAGEILVTSINNDGLGEGLDLGLIDIISKKSQLPIIASGGCGLAQHFVEGYKAGAAAVAAGTYFCRRDQNIMQCRSHIRNAGIDIRTNW